VIKRGTITYVAKAGLLAVIYVALARFGLQIHAVSAFATLVWPPTGIALAAILVLGYRFWPGIAVGALVANLWTGAPLPVALGIALGNTLEALLGAYALRRIPGFRSSLDRLQDVIGLVVLAGVFSSMVSATIGVSSLLFGGIITPERFAVTWRTWWVGDAIGALIIAPLVLTWKQAGKTPASRRRLVEASLLGLLLGFASLFIFELSKDGLVALLSPLLIWAALRFEQRGAARATFLVSVIATWATVRGHGPFMRQPLEEGLFVLQAFMALTAATFLVLGAVASERRRAEEERRRAEEVIREREERYRSLAEAVDQLMWINDADGRAIYVNPKWEEMVGIGPDSHGIRWAELLQPDDRDTLFEIRGRAIPAGRPYRVEFRLRMKDGQYRWMLSRVVPVKDAGGRVTSWFGSASDIHDLKTAEAELRRAKDEAEAANRAKDQFLAALSHELRTPLTPVLAFSSMLETNVELSEEIRRQIEIVRRNTELEARLIDDLLDLTRISSGKLKIEPEPLELAEALDHVVEICREEASAKGLVLERDGTRDGTVVLADPARLRQILWNLLKNAIQFTPSGGRIFLRTLVPAPERIAVEVSDTGAGIEPAEMERIFQPFEQVGKRAGALGLGLAISRGLVEAHGGTLTAASDGPGKGATFRVELAILSGVEDVPRTGRAPRSSRQAVGTRRVLLIEDHADTLSAVRELLAELSCEILAVGSMQEALAAAKTQSFDLVLSDLGLPDGSGLDLMRQLHDRYGLAGIAVTGYGMKDDVRQSREAGFVDHLVKPITFQRLAGAIERFFAGRPALDAQ
jgi:PAS domain S-box-containing protein